MSEWTPGPWEVEYDERESGHVIRMGEAIETPWSFPSEQVIRYDHTISPIDADERKQFATAEANAFLIAAAPDLYEALERVLAAHKARAEWPENDSTKRFDAMLKEVEWAEEAAKNTLAKARGEAQ